MADDGWSALDEELEKALRGEKGKKGKRDSVLFTPRHTIDAASSATVRSGNAKPSDSTRLDRPSVESSAPVPPAVTAAPARAPGEALDAWRALDEELAKLERGKKRRGQKEGRVASKHASSRSTGPGPGPGPGPVQSAPSAPSRSAPSSAAAAAAKPASSAADAFPPDDENVGRAASAHIVGTCDEMCPVAERVFRERERELDVYERVERFYGERSVCSPAASGAGGKNLPAPATSASLCVKRYARIVDDPSPDTVRTRSALERTTRHLYSLLGGKTDAPPAEWETLAGARADACD